MNHYLKADKMIRNLILKGKRKFVLFPFGEQGMLIKQILNVKYNIKEEFIVDNSLSKINAEIKGIEYLKNIECEKFTFLITSDNEDFYSEIRYQLMQYVSIENIVDIFSNSMYFDESIYYESGTTIHPRYAALEAAAREVYCNNVGGDIAEVGVYKGEFANQISRYFPDRVFHLFDTFSGFDSRDVDEAEEEYSGEFRKKTNLDDTTVEEALRNIAYRKNTIVYKGYFPDTAVGIEEKQYAFVSLDTDLYLPILAGLEYFYPRLSPGGYIFVDDLRHGKLRGVKKAVIDFCKKNQIGYVSIPDGVDASAIIVKPI